MSEKRCCKHCRDTIAWDGFDWYHEYTGLYCCWLDNKPDATAEPGGKPRKKRRAEPGDVLEEIPDAAA